MSTNNKKIIGVIPARYGSKRFPGKPLADIYGKPLVWWVYQNAKLAKNLTESYVATDDQRIANACERLQIPVMMTSSKHPTGTDRVGEVAKKIDGDYFVNIQGDEPLLSPETIDAAIEPIFADASIPVSNLMTEIVRNSDLIDSTVPKVVANAKNEAVFLSRLPIPFPKEPDSARYFKQVCVYCFAPQALEQFCSLPEGPIEKTEGIELLRFIENHISVKMVEVQEDTVAVDTPADLEVVRKIIGQRINH